MRVFARITFLLIFLSPARAEIAFLRPSSISIYAQKDVLYIPSYVASLRFPRITSGDFTHFTEANFNGVKGIIEMSPVVVTFEAKKEESLDKGNGLSDRRDKKVFFADFEPGFLPI